MASVARQTLSLSRLVRLPTMTHSITLNYDQWQRVMDALPPEVQQLEQRIASACEGAKEGPITVHFTAEESHVRALQLALNAATTTNP